MPGLGLFSPIAGGGAANVTDGVLVCVHLFQSVHASERVFRFECMRWSVFMWESIYNDQLHPYKPFVTWIRTKACV